MFCYFVSDLHGKKELYEKLFKQILRKPPETLFFGGDLLAHGYLEGTGEEDFINDYLFDRFSELKNTLKEDYPNVFIILGNDDPKINEHKLKDIQDKHKLWYYINECTVKFSNYNIVGYSYVPPTPFGLKDWEKYDVSRFVDPGCSHPFEGLRTVKPDYDTEYDNIKQDLERLALNIDVRNTIFLFHSPPYKTNLDRAALDGKMIDSVPLDVHVGSIAIQRFIQEEQPFLSLHGHIHESSSITGSWKEITGRTYSFSAAYHENKLALVEFDTNQLENATRKLL
ncbi:MAG: hypothetical protein ACLFNL_05510 [Bacteroidales bacterium]